MLETLEWVLLTVICYLIQSCGLCLRMDYNSSTLLSHHSILGGNKNLKTSTHGSLTPGITASTKLPLASNSVTSLLSFKPFKLNQHCGRRALFSFLVATAAGPQGSDSKNALLQEYRKRSIEKKPEYDKQRLDDYYNRNYKDYFELIEGFSKGKSEDLLSESEKGIRQWLQRNKK